MKDWLESKIKVGCPYYEYTVTGGVVSSKVLKGRVNVRRWVENRKELGDMENLALEDKARHVLSVVCRVS